MFSIILATHDSERTLVPTLAALVPGATAGLVREVIVADAGSRDETEKVADIAGCVFFKEPGPPGPRLAAAAARARGDWLMVLHPGVVPGITWIDETFAFVEQTLERPRAAVFAAAESTLARLRRALGALPAPRQGLILRKGFYREIGGHRDVAQPEADLVRRIGRRRLVRLVTPVSWTNI